MPHLTGLDLPLSFYAASAFVLGLIFGSFLNVVIYRVPRGESIVYPGSHCCACGAPVKAFDNIPLLSFALLGGRCRSCRARISFSYPMVELCSRLMFVAIVFKTGPSWEAPLDFAFACVMISLVFIDARHRLLPNVITYPAFLFARLGARRSSAERSSQSPRPHSGCSTNSTQSYSANISIGKRLMIIPGSEILRDQAGTPPLLAAMTDRPMRAGRMGGGPRNFPRPNVATTAQFARQ